jgi:protein ImuA
LKTNKISYVLYLCASSLNVTASKAHIISKLQTEILALQGFKALRSPSACMGLGSMKDAFPNGTFPLGAIHEFVFTSLEDAAATCGFIAGLLSPLMLKGGVIFWIGPRRTLFPPALESFGVHPDKIVFIDVQRDKHVLWSVEEALKCPALTAVVGEMEAISFTASRRLQLAVEQSQVTGFMLCQNKRALTTTASVSRWKISSLPSHTIDELPGVGFPQWRVELVRVRNGRPGVWNVRFADGSFVTMSSSYEDTARGKDNDGTVSESVRGLQQTG